MTWVQIQQAAQHTWDDHQKVGALLGDEKPDGLIVRAAGEVDGRWKSVAIWESQLYRSFGRASCSGAVSGRGEVSG
jgi:hypothetical protein